MLVATCGISVPVAATEPFSFALLADGPYGEGAEPAYDRLIQAINSEPLAFAVHAGDIKAGGEMCTDELLIRRHRQLQNIEHPLIYTPGDNEWTDCHRDSNGNYLPTERLDFLRALFFPDPGMSLGQNPMLIDSQASRPEYQRYVENTVFEKDGVVFVQVHVVGSNNNLAPWDEIDESDSFAQPREDRFAEYNERNDAGVVWLNQAFDHATAIDAAAVFVTIHANPRFDLNGAEEERSGFNPFLSTLLARTKAFDKPVALAHGDFHVFLVDTPRLVPFYANEDAQAEGDNRQVANLVRVQGFGDSENHWVKITVDRHDPAVFSFQPRIVAGNVGSLGDR